jgi:protein phosphatase
MVHEDDIAAELRREDDAPRAASRLVDRANKAGGVDNITVLVLAVTDEDPVVSDVPPAVLVAVAADPLPEPETQPASAPKPRRMRRWGRISLWVIPVVLVLVVAVGAIAWYARKDYFVGVQGTHVTVYKGVPGGVLIWDPTVERVTRVQVDDLTPAKKASVRAEPTFSSLADANDYVDRLRAGTAA